MSNDLTSAPGKSLNYRVQDNAVTEGELSSLESDPRLPAPGSDGEVLTAASGNWTSAPLTNKIQLVYAANYDSIQVINIVGDNNVIHSAVNVTHTNGEWTSGTSPVWFSNTADAIGKTFLIEVQGPVLTLAAGAAPFVLFNSSSSSH